MQNADSSIFWLNTNTFWPRLITRVGLVGAACLARQCNKAKLVRWPVFLLAGLTNIAHGQSTIQDQRSERSGASQMERHASDNGTRGRVGCGFGTSIG